MQKQTAIDFFGSVNLTAEALDISGAAVDKWPELLTSGLEAKVIVAALHKSDWKIAKVRAAFPESFQQG